VVRATEEKLPQAFYTRFVAWRDNGGLSALLYKMLHVDTANFTPGADAPITEAMREMVADDRSDLQDWCHELHEDSEAVLGRDNRFATTEQLLNAYLRRTPNAHINQKLLTTELKEASFEQAADGAQIRVGKRKDSKKVRLWIIRDFKNAGKLTATEIGEEWAARGGSRL
jgi:hypothetical protein